MQDNKEFQIDLIIPNLKVVSQKQAFQVLAKEVAPLCGLPESDLFERLMDREKKSTSGIGDGVAIPYMKFNRLTKPFIALVKLDTMIEYDSLDGEPVDLICMIISPESEGPLHLQRLSRISRLLRDEGLRDNLRDAKDESTIRALVTASNDWMLAA